jgi:hypothetical protein
VDLRDASHRHVDVKKGVLSELVGQLGKVLMADNLG